MSKTEPDHKGRPFVLVVGVDLKESSGFAFDQAARIARRIHGSEMHIIHVGDPETPTPVAEKLIGQVRLYVEEKTAALGGLGGQIVGVHLRIGTAAREIIQLASAVGADMIVLGTHKPPHLKALFVGSVAERVLGGAPCVVVVVGPKPPAIKEVLSIAPPCVDCVQAKLESHGKQWWCARHAEHHIRAHAYSFQQEMPFQAHDSTVSPTGIDS